MSTNNTCTSDIFNGYFILPPKLAVASVEGGGADELCVAAMRYGSTYSSPQCLHTKLCRNVRGA